MVYPPKDGHPSKYSLLTRMDEYNDVCLLNKSSQSYEALFAICDHTSEHTPSFSEPEKLVLDLPTPEGWKAELTDWL